MSPEGARVLAAAPLVTVYREAPHDGFRGTAYACVNATGESMFLDSPNEESAFKPPAISIERHTVGFATEEVEGENDAVTRVWVQDVREDDVPQPGGYDFPGRSVIPTDDFKVGSLVVRSKGAVAWITCPGEPTGAAAFTRTCSRRGERDTVSRFIPGTGRVEVLERGTRIDPQSLTRRGDRIYWRSGRKQRSARLPKVAGQGSG